MSFANRAQKVVNKLLTKFDEREGDNRIMLQKNSSAVWDPVLAEDVITPDAKIPLTGVAVPYSQSMIDGTTIQRGDIKLTITNGVEPEQQDKIILDGVQYSIMPIIPFAYTGKDKTIAYSIQIRR